MDAAQFCCQILSFLSFCKMWCSNWFLLARFHSFNLFLSENFTSFLNLFFFHGTKQNIVIFWLIYICRLACYSKLACYMSKFMRKLEGRFPDLPEFFRWDTHLYMSLFLSTCLSVHPSHTIFFRNHCDHNFWYTCVKWWYLQVIFFLHICFNLFFFGC